MTHGTLLTDSRLATFSNYYSLMATGDDAAAAAAAAAASGGSDSFWGRHLLHWGRWNGDNDGWRGNDGWRNNGYDNNNGGSAAASSSAAAAGALPHARPLQIGGTTAMHANWNGASCCCKITG